jgi:hypothetical protein
MSAAAYAGEYCRIAAGCGVTSCNADLKLLETVQLVQLGSYIFASALFPSVRWHCRQLRKRFP